MLAEIRESATRWVGWVIVFIISATFALFGINSYFEGGGQVAVANVNGTEIDYQQYQNALNQRQRNVSRTMDGNVDSSLFSSPAFRNEVVEGLVSETLFADEVRERGYRISDEQLLNTIRETPGFQRDGAFDPDLYNQTLRSAGYTPQLYEQLQRQQTVQQQFNSAFSESAFVPTATLNQLLTISEQKRIAKYAVVAADTFTPDIVPDEAELKKEYDENQETYRVPDQIRVQFVELTVEDLAAAVELDDDELRGVYAANTAQYIQQEQRKASHILISVVDGADEETIKKAEEQATDLAKRARGGEDFAALAKEFSGDAGSAQNGGDLGIIDRGVMVKPFEDAVFSMIEEDEITDPVRTRFGFHVIRLTGITPEKQKSFADAKFDIAEQERQRLAENLFFEQGELFRNIAYEQPDGLEPISDELDLAIGESEWFSLDSGNGIATEAAVRRAAFAEDVMTNNLNSEAIEIGVNRLIVVRRLAFKDSYIRSFEDAKDSIEINLKQKKSRAAAEETANSLLAQLEEGQEWDKVVEAAGIASVDLPAERNSPGDAIQSGVSKLVFAESTPEGDKPLFGTGSVSRNDFAIYRLDKVEAPNLEELPPPAKDRIESALKQRWGAEQLSAYRARMRENAKISVFEDVLSGEGLVDTGY